MSKATSSAKTYPSQESRGTNNLKRRPPLSKQRSRSENRGALASSSSHSTDLTKSNFQRAHTFGPDDKQYLMLKRRNDFWNSKKNPNEGEKLQALPPGCICGPNLYGVVLGPTADEPILLGLSTFVKLCDGCLDENTPRINPVALTNLETQQSVSEASGNVEKSGDGQDYKTVEVDEANNIQSHTSRVYEDEVGASKSNTSQRAHNGSYDDTEDEEAFDQLRRMSSSRLLLESSEPSLVGERRKSVDTGSSTDRIPIKQSSESQTPIVHVETTEFQTDETQHIESKIQENLLLDKKSSRNLNKDDTGNLSSQHNEVKSLPVISSQIATSDFKQHPSTPKTLQHREQQQSVHKNGPSDSFRQLKNKSHDSYKTSQSTQKQAHDSFRQLKKSHDSHKTSQSIQKQSQASHGPAQQRSVTIDDEEKEVHPKGSKSILKEAAQLDSCTCCGCVDSDSSRFKDSSTSCTCVICSSQPTQTKLSSSKKCKCKTKSKGSQVKIKTCCNCSTSTTTTTPCQTPSEDTTIDSIEVGKDRGDTKQYDVKYAITKITKFHCYTTFEVMKATRKKPRVMPKTLEGVFVLKNKT